MNVLIRKTVKQTCESRSDQCVEAEQKQYKKHLVVTGGHTSQKKNVMRRAVAKSCSP